MSAVTHARIRALWSVVVVLATVASGLLTVAPAQAAADTRSAAAISSPGSVAVTSPATMKASAATLSGADFNPGFIISDANFYDRYAMTQTDIQIFLDSNVGACANSNCLNIARTSSFSRPADAVCAAYQGTANETTASIIFKVQTACGISAKVILVTLQKEQGLITNDGPSDSRLSRAMGYGCPDSAQGVCDAEYSGLYNQIYWAGRQFVRYGNPPGTSNYFTWYPVGTPVAVLYHPDSDRCGASAVTIQNKATAALYYYTPYQPNAAALTPGNLRSVGDSCSSYGNRNFWVYYNDWFGSPTQPAGSAYGVITSATGVPGGIQLTGWSVIPTSVTRQVHLAVQIGQAWTSVEADQPNPAADTAFPGAGPNHGFSTLIPRSPGATAFCLWAAGLTATSVVDCRTVTVPTSPPPVGQITVATGVPGGIDISGWVVQPGAITTPVHLAVNIGSAWISVEADQPNPAGDTAYPGAGQNHGFVARIPATAGSQGFCLWAAGLSGASIIECRTVTVPVAPPAAGQITTAVGVVGGISISGWSVQPSAIASTVHLAVNIGTRWISVEADQPNPAGETAYPGAGQNHGFVATIPAGVGPQSFCLWAAGPYGASVLDCRSVMVPAVPQPVGEITAATGVVGGIALTGWMAQPSDITSAVHMAVNVGSQWISVEADQPNPAGDTAYPGAGPDHGFDTIIPTPVGSQAFCLWVAGPAGATIFDCRTVTVPAVAPPAGQITVATGVVGGISISGWAVQPTDITSAVHMAVNIGSRWISVEADQPNPAGETAYPGAGPNHGFAATIPAAAGSQSFCLWVAGPGGAIVLDCRTVSVPR
ncbi:hypothetical protein BH11ACT4_BH11ACT4_02010 [soil metagenome]